MIRATPVFPLWPASPVLVWKFTFTEEQPQTHAFTATKHCSYTSMFRRDMFSGLQAVSTNYMKRNYRSTCIIFVYKLTPHFLEFRRIYYAYWLHITMKIKGRGYDGLVQCPRSYDGLVQCPRS